VIMCTLDWNGYFRDVNPVFPRTLGYTEAEIWADITSSSCTRGRERRLHSTRSLRLGDDRFGFEARMLCRTAAIASCRGTYRRRLRTRSTASRVTYRNAPQRASGRAPRRMAHPMRLQTMARWPPRWRTSSISR
jgi:hypothetical protein